MLCADVGYGDLNLAAHARSRVTIQSSEKASVRMVGQCVLLASLLKDVWEYVCLSFMLSIVSPVFAYVPPGVSWPVSVQSLLFLGARRWGFVFRYSTRRVPDSCCTSM